jgi:hypothetical protein
MRPLWITTGGAGNITSAIVGPLTGLWVRPPRWELRSGAVPDTGSVLFWPTPATGDEWPSESARAGAGGRSSPAGARVILRAVSGSSCCVVPDVPEVRSAPGRAIARCTSGPGSGTSRRCRACVHTIRSEMAMPGASSGVYPVRAGAGIGAAARSGHRAVAHGGRPCPGARRSISCWRRSVTFPVFTARVRLA